MTHLVFGVALPCGESFEVVANTRRQASSYVAQEWGMMDIHVECIGSIDSRCPDMEGMFDARGQ